jgi:peptidoglycan/xylan/chitin deacetylase (PgdA/CDA1 family)
MFPGRSMMYLSVTIDTEEDNWSDYDSPPVLSNIERIAELQRVFDRYKVKPTYLITYPVATDKNAVSMLREIMEDGRCEIGAHVHPWNTPPFPEERSVRNTMLCNLEKEVQYRKMETLHKMIRKNFNTETKSFRSGRWGFGPSVAENIRRLGYNVDTSVSPYMNWEKYGGPDFSDRSPAAHYIFHDGKESPEAYLLEVPATIGFLQPGYESRNALFRRISGSRLKHFRLIGLLDKLKILNKVMLSPETATGEEMIALAQSVKREGYRILNMFFHSTTLLAGLTPFTKTREDESAFMKRIETFLEYVATSGIESIKLCEARRGIGG